MSEEMPPVVETPAVQESAPENNSHVIEAQPEFSKVDLKIDSFSDILSAAKGPGKKESEKLKEIEVPVEVEEETPAEVEEAPTEEIAAAPAKPKVEPRDFSIFKDEPSSELEHLKKMSNAAFNKYKKLYLDHQELKAKPPVKTSDLPDNYYTNPQGYLLDPKYSQTNQAVSTLDKVADHWKRQEISIRKTGKMRDLFFNEKGDLTVGDEREASDDDEAEVAKKMSLAVEKLGKYRNELENVMGNFRTRHENDVGIIKDAESKFFPKFDDKDHPTRQLQDNVIANLPESMRTHPLAGLVAKLTASNALLVAQANELKAKGKTAASLREDTNGAPPTKSKFSTGNRGPVKLTSFEDFNKIKRGEM